MNRIVLEETDSTNSWVQRNAAQVEAPLMVIARSQTAGRGQRGNHWESEPGKNLTFSLLLRPENFRAADQFSISEAFSLAVCDMLAVNGIGARVKWPNDIYVGDRKICGILIEHSVMGQCIMHTIAGAGINVNQARFLSDAPNPESMCRIAGHEFDLGQIAEEMDRSAGLRLEMCFGSEAGRTGLHREYLGRLWRGDGSRYPFRRRGDGKEFMASVADVERSGMLQLLHDDGSTERFAFKEVEYLLPPISPD